MKAIFNYTLLVLFLWSCSEKGEDVRLEATDPLDTGHKKNIIFMIGDGMGLAQITAARTVNEGSLNMLTCPVTGIQSTHSADEYVTDSGASATAMACGKKANNYTLGLDANGNVAETIVELAEKQGLYTGLITTSEIVHATPAAFFAHQANRYEYEDIALDLIGKGIDFLLGGGRKYFDQRSDGLNVVNYLIESGYEIAENLAQINTSKAAMIFISDAAPLRYLDGRGDVLPQAVGIAANRLKSDDKGFFLMVEGAQIDWACEENNQEYLMAEMLDFDRAVGVALEFAKADGNTLVVITGDHETGGYALLDGNVDGNTVQGEFKTWLHTGMMVPVFAFGPGAESFTGVYENKEFYFKFREYYGF